MIEAAVERVARMFCRDPDRLVYVEDGSIQQWPSPSSERVALWTLHVPEARELVEAVIETGIGAPQRPQETEMSLAHPRIPDLADQTDLAEYRRTLAVEAALRMYPQGAGNAKNLIDSAKEIEKYLRGELPVT